MQDRSFSLEDQDEFMCNCEFGESTECCIFHKNSLSTVAAPSAPFLSASLGSDAAAANLEGTYQNNYFDETYTKTLRESNSSKLSLATKSEASDDVTNLISAIDLGFEISDLQVDSFNCNSKTDSNLNGPSCQDDPGNRIEAKSVVKNSKWSNSEIGKDDETISRIRNVSKKNLNEPTMTTSPNIPDLSRLSPSDPKEKFSQPKKSIISCEQDEQSREALSFLDVASSFKDVPTAKSPCFEEIDKLSQDSFFTESDCNSLIGGIIQNMVGI